MAELNRLELEMLLLLDYRLRVSPPAVEALVQQLLGVLPAASPDAASAQRSKEEAVSAVSPLPGPGAESHESARPAANTGSRDPATAPTRCRTHAAAAHLSFAAVTRAPSATTAAQSCPFSIHGTSGVQLTAGHEHPAPSSATAGASLQYRVAVPARATHICSGMRVSTAASGAIRLLDAVVTC